MNLAVTLLVAVAIAAIIGTVLQQNQPYPDYVLKFGPFWFEIFKILDLFDVYSSSWFLTILTFLVVSTAVCVYRNTPRMLQDMRDYREQTHARTLERLPHSYRWHNGLDTASCVDYARASLERHRYRYKTTDFGRKLLIAAKKGSGSRLGYLFTHVAIVIICIGGLIDGNVPLKFAEMRGDITVETRRIPASEVPMQSTLPPDNLSFRANIDIAEGSAADFAFIDFKDGYLVQQLPFTIKVADFLIEYYDSGQPKSFESDLVILDSDLPEPIESKISVNHPFSYKGYTIYQNSFGDGGSKLNLKLRPLRDPAPIAQQIQVTVKEPYRLNGLMLEISDFRPFNVNPDPIGVKKFRNDGPSFQFKLRRPTGEASEYLNYMQPIEREGAYYYLSGIRNSPAEEFRYWAVPADAERSPERFLKLLAALNDPETVERVALFTARSAATAKTSAYEEQRRVADFMIRLNRSYLNGGINAIVDQIDPAATEEKRREVAELHAMVLNRFLRNVYLDVLRSEGVETGKELGDFDQRFFEDALNTIDVLHLYGSPFFVEIRNFDHIEATGLQITKAPGKLLVFPGCLLLVLGVFFMFYLPQRRIWFVLEQEADQTSLLLAGSAQRNRYDFDREFEGIKAEISGALSRSMASSER